jgi:Skp family chaperone for outer membrane proteins
VHQDLEAMRAPETRRRRRPTIGWIAVAFVALVASALALSACGSGSSSADEAKTAACDAVGDIEQQVDQLQGYTLSNVTAEKVKSNFSAIESDLGTIRTSVPELEGSLKSQLKDANEEFGKQVRSTLSSLGQSTSLAGGISQLETAAEGLGRAYRQAFASVSC